MSLQPFTPVPAMVQQAATPFAGYTLVNGTGNIITWAVPNDGRLHRFAVFASEDVISATTGGAVTVSWTLPDGTAASWVILPATQGATGFVAAQNSSYLVLCRPGTTVTVTQSSALTGGSAVAWAEIWGS